MEIDLAILLLLSLFLNIRNGIAVHTALIEVPVLVLLLLVE